MPPKRLYEGSVMYGKQIRVTTGPQYEVCTRLQPEFVFMHSIQSKPHNLTMEILDNTTNEESMDHVRTE